MDPPSESINLFWLWDGGRDQIESPRAAGITCVLCVNTSVCMLLHVHMHMCTFMHKHAKFGNKHSKYVRER